MYFDSSEKGVRLHGPQTRFDYLEIEHITYQALPLDDNDWYKGIGINSSVFRARNQEDPDGDSEIVKICNFREGWLPDKPLARRRRFGREIDAMRLALKRGKHNSVVRIKGEGNVYVQTDKGTANFRCFLMEPAKCTLREYLGRVPDISLQQRLALCSDLVRSVRALHDIDIYHRDIKPENIFLCEEGWKIGDLGLVAYRGDDFTADLGERKIGPLKWMAPESINKAYCLQRAGFERIDTGIDERSDVYQLGKVCWHIIQGDIPNGCLKSRDLVEAGESVFGSFLKPMLGYRREERPTLAEVQVRLLPITRAHSI